MPFRRFLSMLGWGLPLPWERGLFLMRLLLRRGVTVLAIYAVALHVILLGLALIAANGEIVNPFSVICHSAAPAAAGDEAPGKPDLIPGHACEHCNLCSAAPPSEPRPCPSAASCRRGSCRCCARHRMRRPPASPSVPISPEVPRASPDMRPLIGGHRPPMPQAKSE